MIGDTTKQEIKELLEFINALMDFQHCTREEAWHIAGSLGAWRAWKTAKSIDAFEQQRAKVLDAEHGKPRPIVRLWVWFKKALAYASEEAQKIRIDE